MEDGHFIDSNVLFDIVYAKRVRHETAMKFYKEFKNLQLAIEPAVQFECNAVVLRFVFHFTTEFRNYLSRLEKEGKGWDRTTIKKRSTILTSFLVGRHPQDLGSEENFKPFYTEIINLMKTEAMRLNYGEMVEFLSLLPERLISFLRGEINSRFSKFTPHFDITNSDIPKFIEVTRKALSFHFSNGSLKGDLKIVLSLLQILKYGCAEKTFFGTLTLYTHDEPFITSYDEFSAKLSMNSDPNASPVPDEVYRRLVVKDPYPES
jgi:hypothetical protein